MPHSKRQPIYESAAFPEFRYGHVLPPKISPEFRSMPELHSSLAGAIYMASQIEQAQGSLHLRVEPVRALYFRAALAELVRVEDFSKTWGKEICFKQTNDPLLHVIKLLRNYEVHIGAFAVSSGVVQVRFGDMSGIYQSFIATNISAMELRKLKTSSSYSDPQLYELVQLFDVHQRRFGVVQLIYNTVLHVAKLLGKA